MTDIEVSALCVGRFTPLAQYLTDIYVSDLRKSRGDTSSNDIVAAIPIEHQLLCKAFIRDVMVEYFYQDSLFVSAYGVDNETSGYLPIPIGGLLKLCGRVLSNVYGNVNEPLCMQVSQLPSKVNGLNFTRMCISRNDLVDDDVQYIIQALANQPDGSVMLYANDNSFQNVSTITTLLGSRKLSYLDIRRNKFRGDVWDNLGTSEYTQLIWIEEAFLPHNRWQTLVTNSNLHSTIISTHQGWYAQYDTLN